MPFRDHAARLAGRDSVIIGGTLLETGGCIAAVVVCEAMIPFTSAASWL